VKIIGRVHYHHYAKENVALTFLLIILRSNKLAYVKRHSTYIKARARARTHAYTHIYIRIPLLNDHRLKFQTASTVKSSTVGIKRNIKSDRMTF
jgi:hypothetical protein